MLVKKSSKNNGGSWNQPPGSSSKDNCIQFHYKNNKFRKNSEEKGHPFSHCEVKPLNLWQRICEHFGVTHIVDLTPGSAGIAIGATGAMEYEGVAANEIHCSWLDSTLDLVVKYIASKDKVFANKLGGRRRFRGEGCGILRWDLVGGEALS